MQHIVKFQQFRDNCLHNIPADALAIRTSVVTLPEALLSFFDYITQAITKAGNDCSPHSRPRKNKGHPGWDEYNIDAWNKSVFWNNV